MLLYKEGSMGKCSDVSVEVSKELNIQTKWILKKWSFKNLPRKV